MPTSVCKLEWLRGTTEYYMVYYMGVLHHQIQEPEKCLGKFVFPLNTGNILPIIICLAFLTSCVIPHLFIVINKQQWSQRISLLWKNSKENGKWYIWYWLPLFPTIGYVTIMLMLILNLVISAIYLEVGLCAYHGGIVMIMLIDICRPLLVMYRTRP